MFAHYFSALVVVTWSNKLERSLTLSCYNCSAADEKNNPKFSTKNSYEQCITKVFRFFAPHGRTQYKITAKNFTSFEFLAICSLISLSDENT